MLRYFKSARMTILKIRYSDCRWCKCGKFISTNTSNSRSLYGQRFTIAWEERKRDLCILQCRIGRIIVKHIQKYRILFICALQDTLVIDFKMRFWNLLLFMSFILFVYKCLLTVSGLAKVAIFTTNVDAEHETATFAKPVLAVRCFLFKAFSCFCLCYVIICFNCWLMNPTILF